MLNADHSVSLSCFVCKVYTYFNLICQQILCMPTVVHRGVLAIQELPMKMQCLLSIHIICSHRENKKCAVWIFAHSSLVFNSLASRHPGNLTFHVYNFVTIYLF